MFHCEHLSRKVLLAFHVILCFRYAVAKPGIDTIRRQYGISGLLSHNETIVGEIHKIDTYPNAVTVGAEPEKKEPELRMEDDYDYSEYDEAMSRSLFPVNPEPAPVQNPLPFGKCQVEVLTSTLVKPNARVPPGNGSNGHLSVIQTCCPGYVPYVHDKNQCVAVCQNPCINGICVRPNVCECFPDHVRSLSGDCIPTCPIFCLNGHCHWNGTCTCNAGYVFDPSQKFCVPYCSRGCGELFNCTSPEICTCLKGYTYNHINRRCEPICRQPCGNGDCIRPDMCSCFAGFRLVNNTCQANCSRGCERGRCVANEVCACEPGWALDQTGVRCEPHCPQGCSNGKCLEPGKCICNAGYKNENNKCVPRCSRGCLNGRCTAPDTCTCRPGYTLNFYRNKCKKITHRNSEPIFDPVVEVRPAPPPPIFNPPIIVPPPSYPQQPASNPFLVGGVAKPAIVQPQVERQPIQKQTTKKPLFSVPLVVNPSAPEIAAADKDPSIYDRQPAFNPFFQSNQNTSSVMKKPNYLEKQPAFNPNFPETALQTTHKTTTSPRRTTPRPTKPKATAQRRNYETTSKPRKSFFSFNFWSSSKNSTEKSKQVKTTTLKPTCSKACLNGKCTGKNYCTCNSGYVKAVGSEHKCIPYCPKGCSHGTCSAPGFCTCKFGYKKQHGKCIKK